MYDSKISINSKFKSSVNLQYDLNNLEKIDEYIPTTDLCDVIKYFLLSILGRTSDRATLLVGPYGKGKSYLMLIIIYLISIKKDSKKAEQSLLLLKEKIMKVDAELVELINEIEEKELYLLPVIINSNYSYDINQIFTLSLINALADNKIKNIRPQTSFTEALNLVEKWEKDLNNGAEIVKKCLEHHADLNTIKNGLEEYKVESYKEFESLYECITYGAKFNPFVGNDFVMTYQSVVNELCKKTKYKGVFIIFDEFGFFLENQTNDFSERLKNIEFIAEKCKDTSLYNQIHFCCVTHKDIELYNQNDSKQNLFSKVAKRFKKKEFDRSLEENYDIISGAIKKNNDYYSLVKKFKKENKELISNISNLDIYDSREKLEKVLDNSFPFNPIALYSLIQVSEKIGQNERTLFTFISDNDVNTFKYFIINNDSGLINVDLIYDYFEDTLKNNPDTFDYYNNVEIIKKRDLRVEVIKIFKAIAIIKVINDPIKLPCTKHNIALSLGLLEENLNNTFIELFDQNILKESSTNKFIDYTSINNRIVNEKINDIVALKFVKIDIAKAINDLNVKKYFVSHKYNFENKMIRYFETTYLANSDFKNLTNLNLLLEDIEADGLIINLVYDEDIDIDLIKNKLKSSTNNIIVKWINKKIDEAVVKKIKLYLASKYYYETAKDLLQNDIESIKIYIQDLNDDIVKYIDELYDKADILCNLCDCQNLNDMIYNVFNSYYSQTIKINNDQINKNEITKVSSIARNRVIDSYINNYEFLYSSTSAETTINNSFIKVKDTNVTDMICNMLINNGGKKVSIDIIAKFLKDAPIGMRNGVIPLFIGYSISKLNIKQNDFVNTVVFYRNDVEIDLNANNLELSLKDPKNYYLCYETVSCEVYQLTLGLLETFGCKPKGNLSVDIKLLINAIRNYIHNLAPIYSKSTVKDNLLNLTENELAFINIFLNNDLNNYKTLFVSLPQAFKMNYKELVINIKIILENLNSKLDNFYKHSIDLVKDYFELSEGTLYSSYRLWKDKVSYLDNLVLEDKYDEVYKALEEVNYNDKASINMLSNKLVKCTIDDWNMNKASQFYLRIREFADYIETIDIEKATKKTSIDIEDNIDDTLSSLGETLYDNLLSNIEDYGTAISKEERIKILKKLLKETLQ